MAVMLVTDSTADLPAAEVERLGVTVIPQNVHFGEATYKDNVTITPSEFFPMLEASQELPKTSQASPGDFKEMYESLAAGGADGIVSIHVSSKLSGTYNSAVQGASLAEVDCPVEVVDSAQASMGVGLMTVAAAESAASGASHDEVAAVAHSAVGRADCVCLFETLEYLQKGGRLGKARALIATALKIKPMIIIREGEVQELGKARKFSKALGILERTVRGFGPLDYLAVMYSTTPDLAHEVAGRMGGTLARGREPYVTQFGPALGVYTGPGAIGMAVLRSGA